MSITDELREWANGFNGPWKRNEEALRAIADRIDAEADDNERFRRDVEPFCDRLREAAAERADVTMFGVDYVALPVDADRKPIRVGDTLDGYGETTVVKELTLGDDGWSMTCGNGLWFDFAAFTHHHEPTVEDVLREFAEKITDSQIPNVHPTYEEAIAEYAAKLRLANDGEGQ